MSFIGVYLILLAFPFAEISSLPRHAPTPRLMPSDILASNSEITEDGRPLWGGDMRLTDDQIDILTNGVSERAAARKTLSSRWPGGQIPYIIDSSISPARDIIEQAMKSWSDNTCLSFIPVQDTECLRYLHLKHTGGGCNSMVGFIRGEGPHTISLDLGGCTFYPTTAHELGHAIGLWHEDDRLDREQYLTLHRENMVHNGTYYDNIDRHPDVMHYDVPYDYGSVMSPGVNGGTMNDRMTLVPKDPLGMLVMGDWTGPSFYDYMMVNRMYNCTANCNLNCMNGGYAASNKVKGCRCECLRGFSGDRCQTRVNVAFDSCDGGRITTEQTISTPNYPDERPGKLKCAWLIEAPAGKYAQIIINDFDFSCRNNEECPYDRFIVRLNDLQSDDPGQTYCETQLAGKTITSASRQMLIMVYTVDKGWGRGFQADVRFTTQKGSGL